MAQALGQRMQPTTIDVLRGFQLKMDGTTGFDQLRAVQAVLRGFQLKMDGTSGFGRQRLEKLGAARFSTKNGWHSFDYREHTDKLTCCEVFN